MNLAAKVRRLSEPGFRARFGTEEQCLAVLFEMRWGRGVICERCGCQKYSRMKSSKQVQCNACKHQTGFPMATGSGKKAAQWPSFDWVNTTLGNIKTALAATYHHVSNKHA